MLAELLSLTLILETLTVFGRFQFGPAREWHKKRRTRWRVHHGYIGIALMAAYVMLGFEWMLLIGAALFLSDAIHHFVVLPMWSGQTEFP